MAEERAMTKAAEQRAAPERPAAEIVAFPPSRTEASGMQAAAHAAAAKLREFLEGRARLVEVMAALVAPFNASPLDESVEDADGADDPPIAP